VTDIAKPAPPAFTLAGEIDVSVDRGLLMVKVKALDTPPPWTGFDTVTWAVPAEARSLPGIAVVNCVSLTKVVP